MIKGEKWRKYFLFSALVTTNTIEYYNLSNSYDIPPILAQKFKNKK